MARVTVEDCIRQVPSRFELILMAATRSRQISSGQPLLIERDNDRDPIVALREIADGKITAEEMNEKIITDLSRPTSMDEASIGERRLFETDASEMSEEEMLKSLTALEAKTSQSSPYMLANDEEVDFEQEKPEQVTDELADEMPIEAISMELPTDELPADEMPTDEMPTDAMIAAEELRIAEEEASEEPEGSQPEGPSTEDLQSEGSSTEDLPSDEEPNETPNSDDTPI